MKEKILELRLERGSVCAGDDCDAPHTQILSFVESATIHDVVTRILKINYLASIAGGRATWVVLGKSNIPVAVLTQQWRIPRFLVDANAVFTKYIEGKIHIQYRQQVSPDDVFEELRKQ